MGLAASQCRLLFLTSRQTDVSAKMQKISNSKMALARDEDEISDQYNKMLNGTIMKKVGSDEEITYSNMMGGAAGLSGTEEPAFIMKGGQLVLDGRYITKLGISDDAKARGYGDGKDITVSREDFIASMTGATAYDIQQYEEFQNSAVMTWKKDMKKLMSSFGSYPPPNEVTKDQSTIISDIGPLSELCAPDTNGGRGGKKNSALIVSSMISLTEIMNSGGDKTVLYCGDNLNIYNSYRDNLKSKLIGMGIDSTSVSNAINTTNSAYQQYKAPNHHKSGGTDTTTDGGYKFCRTNTGDQNMTNALCAIAQANNCIARARNTKGTYYYAFSAKNFTNDVFTQLRNELKKNTGSSNIVVQEDTKNAKGKTSSQWKNEFIKAYNGLSNKPDYSAEEAFLYYVGKEQEPEVDCPVDLPKEKLAQLAFYGALWDKAQLGWVYDTNVNDPSKFQEGLQNGTYTIETGGKNNKASNSEIIEEVSDPEARAKAEHFWDVEMRKINRKEKEMDTQLQKLQTEYSGITSDIESVKSILNANIQKSFSYCQNG